MIAVCIIQHAVYYVTRVFVSSKSNSNLAHWLALLIQDASGGTDTGQGKRRRGDFVPLDVMHVGRRVGQFHS